MVRAGLELLDTRGLSLTYEAIGYAKVFGYLESEYSVRVSRGSVHERIWASHEDFRSEVLAESVRYFPRGRFANAMLVSASAATSPEEFVRDLGSRTFPKVIRSQMSGQLQSLKALASRFDDPVATETLSRLLDERAESSLAYAAAELPPFLARLGLVPKTSLGLDANEVCDLFCSLIAALVEGGQLNYHSGSHDIAAAFGFMSISAEDDDPWRISSIGVKCFLDFLYDVEVRSAGAAAPVPVPGPRIYPKVDVADDRSDSANPRRPRSRLKALVLAAAVELLQKDMLELQPELLKYSSVLAHIEQTTGVVIGRGSFHRRIWDDNNDYRDEVLARSLAVNAAPLPELVIAIRETQPVLSADGVIDRQRTAHEVIRNAAASLSGAGAESVVYRRLLQIKALLIDQNETASKTALRAAVAEVERHRLARNSDEVQRQVKRLGFGVRPETGLTEGEALGLMQTLNMTTGAGIRFNELAGMSAAARSTMLPKAGGDGQTETWTLGGIATRSFFDQLYELTDRPASPD